MSYQTYITEALVCGSFDSNTADRSFLLFTKRAGMLYATARSVREERSRQRYALQDFSLVQVSLVRGKTGWRIGSIESVTNLFSTASTREARGSVVRYLKLVRAYIRGEEAQPHIYEESVSALRFLANQSLPITREVADNLLAARLLWRLGYAAPAPAVERLLQESLETVDMTTCSPAMGASLAVLVDTATQSSHL